MSLLMNIGDIKQEFDELEVKEEFLEGLNESNTSKQKKEESSLSDSLIKTKKESGIKVEDEKDSSQKYPIPAGLDIKSDCEGIYVKEEVFGDPIDSFSKTTQVKETLHLSNVNSVQYNAGVSGKIKPKYPKTKCKWNKFKSLQTESIKFTSSKFKKKTKSKKRKNRGENLRKWRERVKREKELSQANASAEKLQENITPEELKESFDVACLKARMKMAEQLKDEMLMEAVKGKPELYDLRSPYYSDTVAKRRSWMEIGRQMGCEVSKCKDRWECLRGQYRKQINKITKSGQAATTAQKWKYEDQMSFLRPLLKDRTRVTSVQQDEAEVVGHIEDTGTEQLCSEQVHEENDDAADVNFTIPQKEASRRKRKLQQNDTSASATLMRYLVEKKKEEQPTHPIDTFFTLMATTVKKFKPADQHFIKTQIFSMVSDVELKYIQNLNEQTQAPPTYTCPLSSVSPAPSLQSTSSSTSTQHGQFNHTYQEPTRELPSDFQPNCTLWPKNDDSNDFTSL